MAHVNAHVWHMYGTCKAHALGIMRKNLFWGHSVRPGTKKEYSIMKEL